MFMLSPLFHPREHAVQKILPGVSDHADGELSMTGVITAMMTLGDSFAKRAQTQPLLLRAGDLDRCDEQGSKENERARRLTATYLDGLTACGGSEDSSGKR